MRIFEMGIGENGSAIGRKVARQTRTLAPAMRWHRMHPGEDRGRDCVEARWRISVESEPGKQRIVSAGVRVEEKVIFPFLS
jgi:hypothetical protein